MLSCIYVETISFLESSRLLPDSVNIRIHCYEVWKLYYLTIITVGTEEKESYGWNVYTNPTKKWWL